jgi:adenylate kinase
MDKGDLASNTIVGGFLSETIKDSRYEKGYVLDGWARQLSDLDHFDPNPDHVLFLEVSFETSKQRTLSRRVCENGQHSYNLVSNPPMKEGVCDIDGSKLVKRDDDNLEVLENRWDIYKEKTLKVKEFFIKKGVLHVISAEHTPESIFEEVKRELNI